MTHNSLLGSSMNVSSATLSRDHRGYCLMWVVSCDEFVRRFSKGAIVCPLDDFLKFVLPLGVLRFRR